MHSRNANIISCIVTLPNGKREECVWKSVSTEWGDTQEKLGEIVSELLVQTTMHLFSADAECGLLLPYDCWGKPGKEINVLSPKKDMDLYTMIEMHNENHRQIQVEYLRSITQNVASGLKWLHKHHLVHADVKPENILVEKQNGGVRAFLADYGLCYSERSEDGQEACCCGGSMGYAAPELRNNFSLCGTFNDIWSFGLVVYLVAMAPESTLRWLNIKNEWIMQQHDDCKIDLANEMQDLGKDHLLTKICRRALDWNPSTRITASEIVQAMNAGVEVGELSE